MQKRGPRRFLAALAVVIGALLVPGVAFAQTGKISGVVTDAGTGQPIEGVQIQVQGTGFGALTQANGRYFIISVPPGNYTIIARRIGYQSVEQSAVDVRIDATREINFRMTQATAQLQVQRIVAEQAPLVERGITGSSQSINAEVIQALPVTDVAGVLALQQGFVQVPQNTDIVSFSDSRRQVQTPIRIRGGRGNETLTLIDGFPIINPVFGGAAFDVNTTAIQSLNYEKGGFEAQYGNAQSGIINIATREGGTQLAGNFEYQNSGLSGALGSKQDELLNYDLFRGFLGGPIPGTANRLRFMVSGQQRQSADAVQEYDDDVRDFTLPTQPTGAPYGRDLFPGWRAFGYDQQRDLVGKMTFLPSNSTRINVLALDYSRQRRPSDFDFNLVGFNTLSAPAVDNRIDSLLVGGVGNETIIQGSIDVGRRFYGATAEQRFGRTNVVLRLGRLEQQRETCNYFNGVCLASRFEDTNFEGQFVSGGVGNVLTQGTDTFYGGEDVTSDIARLDITSQVTDHHEARIGAFWTQHDLRFAEVRNLGTNGVLAVPQQYSAKPIEFATYIQDKIEYDFLTVKLGARFDYGNARGSSYADPRDPNNGTTAREVCNGTAPTLGATTPYTFVDTKGTTETADDVTLTGLAACGADTASKNLAIGIAQQDDFAKAKARTAFAPRILVNFPLTERASLFFNFGRYNQNPVYNNLYQNTGVGTVAGEAGGNVCPEGDTKPNSQECFPVITSDGYTPPFVGNANLKIEQTTNYEIGYAQEFGSNYAFNMVLFSKDQTGLTGVRASKTVFDYGVTYNQSAPRYNVIVNQDYNTSRGFEMQLRRRPQNFWGFDINYSFSKATTNAFPPDVQQQRLTEGDEQSLIERRSEVDQPHVLNASLIFRVDRRAPSFRFGEYLRNSYATFTSSYRSGLPYTAQTQFNANGNRDQLDVNGERMPATSQTNLLAGKDFQLSNVQYGVFVRVNNLFDQRNCIQVFVTTGTCDAGTIDQDRARNGNAVGEDSPSTYFDRPTYYGERRSAFAGLRVRF